MRACVCVCVCVCVCTHTEVGDIENARALFERALSEREVSASAQLWRHYANLEAQYGSLAAAVQVRMYVHTVQYTCLQYIWYTYT